MTTVGPSGCPLEQVDGAENGRRPSPMACFVSFAGLELLFVHQEQTMLALSLLATGALAMCGGLAWSLISLLAATRTDVTEWRVDGWRRTTPKSDGGVAADQDAIAALRK